MPSPLEAFRATDRTRFDREFWEKFRAALTLELETLKAVSADWQAATNQLAAVGLARINEVLAPAYAEIIELAHLGGLLTAHSGSGLGVALGETELVIDEAERQRFAPSGYLVATATDESGAKMAGPYLSFDRATGVLRLDVVEIAGAGSHEGWQVAIGMPEDATHRGRTDNPHGVTAEQVGAYTEAQADAAIATAIANRVRVDAAQAFTDPQKAQARANIGVQGATDVVAGLVEMATSVEALAGNDNVRAVTSAGLASAKFLNTDGYMKLPGGLIIQWGETATVTSGTETFATTFPFACVAVVATPKASIARFIVVHSFTTANFQFAPYTDTGGNSASPATYIAIGY